MTQIHNRFQLFASILANLIVVWLIELWFMNARAKQGKPFQKLPLSNYAKSENEEKFQREHGEGVNVNTICCIPCDFIIKFSEQ